jgi:hypothetical protein
MRAGNIKMMRKLSLFALLFVVAAGLGGSSTPEWKTLAPGLEITIFKTIHRAPQGDSKITILRIDPAEWDLEFAGSSRTDKEEHTAREWSASRKFTAAINAGMFRPEGDSHAGYLLSADRIYSRKITSYQSLAAFDPRDAGHPRFHIFDLDAPTVDVPRIVKDYGSVVQNLRLIQSPGVNKWRQENKRASEAALGEDVTGHILFIFARSPFSMYEMNQTLLEANIGLVAAQYLEGGPEAQLYVHAGNTELEMFGSYETAFEESDTNSESWPIPNVLAIRPRKAH